MAQIADFVAGENSQTDKGPSDHDTALVILQITDEMSSLWLFFLVGGALSLVMAVFLGVRTDVGLRVGFGTKIPTENKAFNPRIKVGSPIVWCGSAVSSDAEYGVSESVML